MSTNRLILLAAGFTLAIPIVPAIISHALAFLVVSLMAGTFFHLASPRPRPQRARGR